MRILLLAQRVPFPPNRGDKIPNYHYIRHLARDHEVVVACLAENRQDMEYAKDLAPLVDDVIAVPLSRTRARLRALAALATGKRPLTVAYFDEPELRRRVQDHLTGNEFDLAFVCSSGMASFVESFDLPKVIQFTDLDSQKWRLYSDSSRFPKNYVYRAEASRLLDYEGHIARSFDYSLFCSDRELADFHRLIPGVPARCIRNGVDLEYFRPTEEPKNRDNLVFTGVMNYRPNVEGVVWFCREIFPRIRESIPGATFTVCGASPDNAVRQLANLTGVTVTGAVPDVRPYLARASIGVIPVRIARGIQNKLLEAMAMGLPTVTTSAARAGLDAEGRNEFFEADDPAMFAAAVVQLLRDDSLRAAMGREARVTVEKNYRWELSMSQLDEVFADVAGNRRIAGGAGEGTVSDLVEY